MPEQKPTTAAAAGEAREVAPWSVVVYRGGREYHALSADTMHQIGERMIMLGRSHTGSWWRRWRHSRE